MTRDDLLGCHCYEIQANSDKPAMGCPVAAAIKTGKLHKAEKNTPV
ncbi:hypothetical protein ACFL9U_10665 [Thermodesulfobacteriota bacterium]